jgi:TolA-binding protein
MIEEERHIDLFEVYRNNELGESELKDFEARLSYDSDFRNAFEEYQRVEDGIRNHFRNELKSKLQELDKAMDETPKKHSIVRLIAWTSSVAAAIVIGVFIFQHFVKPNHIELAQNYWPHEEGLPVKMSTKGKYDAAMNAFKLEEWDKANVLLQEIESDTANYFLGMVFYEKSDLNAAQQQFLLIDEFSNYYEIAQFRLALTYLKNNQIELATKILNHLIEKNSPYKNDANSILKQMN